MKLYLATFKNRKWEIEAKGLWDAVQKARDIFNLSAKDFKFLEVTQKIS